ncbi:MAG TPA: hypothetical protein VF988_03695 [Verrucomicrobiae bacterium]
MKLNNTLVMAALIAGSLFAADVAARAQDTTNTPTPHGRPPLSPALRARFNFDFLAQQLALSEDQKPKAKSVFEDMQQQFAALRRDTTVQGAVRAAKIKEIQDGATTKLKEVLTPEQLAKWQKLVIGTRRQPMAPTAPAAPATNAPTPPQ